MLTKRKHGNQVNCWTTLAVCLLAASIPTLRAESGTEPTLSFRINQDGSYSICTDGLKAPVLRAGIAARIDGRSLLSGDYPTNTQTSSIISTPNGKAIETVVRFSGRADAPALTYRLLTYARHSYGEIQVAVANTSPRPVHVEAIRIIDSEGPAPDLGAPASEDRILSDSFSEDTPAIRIRDLQDADAQMHRGVGSQLIYNRQSKWSLFAGALTSDRFITLLKLHIAAGGVPARIDSYAADSTGTTEITSENSLAESNREDRIALSLPLAPGAEIKSERLLVSVSKDYHGQLEQYGAMIREQHRARVSAPPTLGWWSWTAHYYGLNEDAAMTNALWLKQNLAGFGYNYFHMDEGYQYARGDYTTPDSALFPHGVAALEDKVRGLGLTPGLWTAPFEVSERSVIFEKHKDWLVKNGQGAPIHLGWANNHHDRLYALDTTNPEAQQYLRSTYTTLVKDWGIRYIKLDFMDDSCVEGYRFRPATTALEAQRIGLDVIRGAVGDDVQLDKDGSPMLNPVGYVDYGRTGQDTGHTFAATKEAAPAIAARYYMNRNLFVNDPDAFTVSTQTVRDHTWNGGVVPLTLDEAKVSIALSAVSGGMFEIGDDLPTLGKTLERVDLVKNTDLLDMARLGVASSPVDLMSFDATDGQPSIFFLRESPGQRILTVFNWTDHPRSRTLSLGSLSIALTERDRMSDVFDVRAPARSATDQLAIEQPAHSVAMFKIVDSSIDPKPDATPHLPDRLKGGESGSFTAGLGKSGKPIVSSYGHLAMAR